MLVDSRYIFHTAVRPDFIQFIGSRRVNSVCGALLVCSLLVFIRGGFMGAAFSFSFTQ